VKVRFPPDLLAAVDAECERRDVTRSELLRCIVAAAVGTPNHKSSGAGA
jgi:metal-responsive CopG/Arc/MetJ family transcriptional regulator